MLPELRWPTSERERGAADALMEAEFAGLSGACKLLLTSSQRCVSAPYVIKSDTLCSPIPSKEPPKPLTPPHQPPEVHCSFRPWETYTLETLSPLRVQARWPFQPLSARDLHLLKAMQ